MDGFGWDIILQSLPKLLEGLWVTAQLVLVSGLFGLLLALPLGIARSSPRPWVRALPFGYIFFFRGTPLLVQLFLIYYGLAQFEAIRQGPLWYLLREPYVCALLTFSLHTAAYIAEILRGALQAVPPGEVEAARAIGMGRWLTLRRVLLPRAAQIGLPAYGNEVILMVKGSALASTITLLDLTGMARTLIAGNYRAVEMFLAAGVLYLIFNWVLQRLFRLAERAMNRHLREPPRLVQQPVPRVPSGLDPPL
ncbi:ABC transporter permease [Roseospirillum parvum]|uniref:Polar amino acid transport system permease protein n=1 Tax=Roseospirillum parvum TaxID=83401 RepID=A0A1G7TM39_9PROT|nr:ABC transporter permease [Roseospirillum parvum]SDG35739.1 polar amino acid transport system permease protein [Roseospirillum parvum]